MRDQERGGREPWVEEIDRSWRPEPLDEIGRARFDARLGERLGAAARPWTGDWLAPAAAALAVLALAWWGFRPPAAPPAQEMQLAEWEWELLLSDEFDDEAPRALPDEYAAIASAFLTR